jgi:hypothetical protein
MQYISNSQVSLALASALVFMLTPAGAVQVFKYVDENGTVVYTDKPIGEAIRIQANTGPSGKSTMTTTREPSSKNAEAPQVGLDASGFTPTSPAGSQSSPNAGAGESAGAASSGSQASGAPGGGGGAAGGGLSSNAAGTKGGAAANQAADAAQSSRAGVAPSLAAAAPSATPARPSHAAPTLPNAPPLTLSGTPTLRFLAAPDFAAGKLRGFELGDASNSSVPPDGYFKDLVATGANLGRVWLQLRRCSGCNEYTLDNMQIRNMDYYVSKARDNGIWIVFLMTTGDERAGDLWTNPGLQSSLVAIWQYIASRYKDVPEVAGFDLMNEPIVTWEDLGSSRLLWFRIATDITAAIRAVDQKHVVVVEPTPGGETYAFEYLTPIQDSNLVYSLHMYQPLAITHQGVSADYPMTGIPYPSSADSPVGVWDKAKLSDVLEPVRAFSKRTGIPIYVGEFSCSRLAPSGSRDRYVADLASLFQAENWAWTFHAWRAWPTWDPENVSTDPGLMAYKRNVNSSTMAIIRSYFTLNKP